MRVFITCPTFRPHGGIRVIMEWANNLVSRGWDVVLRCREGGRCDWFPLDYRVRLVPDDRLLRSSDCLIVCSPHAIDYLKHKDAPGRRFVFMQMAEHLFRPTDLAWIDHCREFYCADCPLFLLSSWNWEVVRTVGRTGITHYIGNGVNLEHFPITNNQKHGNVVLVEGWYPGNPTKDVDRIGARVAGRLRRDGCRILAYGPHYRRNDQFSYIPHEFVINPSLSQLNDLYERATILIKATKCDARACAPMEAMTKGTVTVRAIELGDDDLLDGVNCLRVAYNLEELHLAAKRLLNNTILRERLADNCRAHVQAYTWNYWFDKIEPILCAN